MMLVSVVSLEGMLPNSVDATAWGLFVIAGSIPNLFIEGLHLSHMHLNGISHGLFDATHHVESVPLRSINSEHRELVKLDAIHHGLHQSPTYSVMFDTPQILPRIFGVDFINNAIPL